MMVCSFGVIFRKYSEFSVAGLMAVVVLQGIGYGLVFDLNFFLRNLSVMGGLLMVLSDSWVRKKFAPAGLPQLDEKDKKMYFQLAGRVLLIFLFVGFVFRGDWGFWRIIASLLGLVACIMVVVGKQYSYLRSARCKRHMLTFYTRLQGQVQRHHARSYPQRLQPVCQQLVDAAPAPPPQGFRQVRLLPNSFNCWRSPLAGQHGPRTVLCRREEEGLLDCNEIWTMFTHHDICLHAWAAKTVALYSVYTHNKRGKSGVQDQRQIRSWEERGGFKSPA